MVEQRAAVVTGAASGIGAATVERFVEGDYDVVAALDVNEAVAERYADEAAVRPFVVDVSDFDAVEAAVDAVEEDADIDALVNCAGTSRYYWIGDLEPDEWHDIVDINLTGQYHLVHAAAPAMFERESGYIVNVSSGAGQRGSASGGVHYSAAKAGIFGLTKGLAKQLAPHVRVNCVVPGLMDTPLATDSDLWTEEELEAAVEDIPLQMLGDPDAAARLIEFLCGPGAEYMTGSVVNVDGGSSLS
jgi:NAD(P)-dependent dehydrogenase (short-subunit alcohol dehydrogenase family)